MYEGWITMKLKTVELNGATYAELQDGHPVYVHDDGKAVPFDAAGTVATITRLNAEARDNRLRYEKAEGSLKSFEGIEDAAAARKALDVVKNLDAKKLVDAGEIEKVRAEAIKAVEDKYSPVVKERDRYQQALVAEKIGGSFARSKLIAEKLAIPPDMVEARFGASFKLEGDSVVAYDNSGNKLYSRAKPGEVAGFDEALEMLIDQYPHKDHILKGSGASGSGSKGSGSGAGDKTIGRAQFDQLDAGKKMEFIKGGGKIAD